MANSTGEVNAQPKTRGLDLSEAEARYRTGDVRSVIDDYPDSGSSARIRVIRAMALFDLGDVTGSIAALLAIIRDTPNHSYERFDARLALFLRSSDFESPTELLPSLTELRQLATRLGTAKTLAALHLAVARVEGLRGHLRDAHRHLQLSRTLSGDTPDEGVACSLDLVEGSLECVRGNLSRSRDLAQRCRDRAVAAGFAKYVLGAATNLGVVALHEGRQDRAQRYFEHLLPKTSQLTYVRLGVLDSLCQLELDRGNTESAASLLAECAAVSAADRVPARSWYDLAHQLTRGTYFERLGQWQEVVAIAEETEPELARRQYKTLSTTLLCLKARALGRLGAHDQAETALGLAVRTCPRGAVDPLIVLEASQGLCAVLRGEAEMGHAHVERAVAGCRAIGHQYHERWITRAVEDLHIRQRAFVPGTSRRDSVSDGLVLADVATILGAGHSVDLMAHRTVSLLRGTPLGPRVEVKAEGGCEYQPEPTATCHTAPDGTVALELRGSDRCVTIRVSRVDTIDEIAIIKNIADLLQAAVSRTSDPGQDDDDQDLWPKAAIASDDDAVFRSPRMVELLKIATRLAATDLPVLLTGETGTGKEIFARLIHDHSRQRRGPFVPFNCSAIARDLVESQLFGHRRGAFTGAHETFGGVIRSAERGTLFLDEVGDLDPAIQPKLLRFLEHGEVHAVGEPRPHTVAVRLVAATNADLEALIHQGRFRSDLYYRLGVTKLVIPPLRERKDEIPAMASRFVARASRECGRVGLRLGDDFLAALLLYDWPGNIRELVNEIRRVVALAADGDVLSAQQLSPGIASRWRSRPATPVEPPPPGLYVRLDQTLAQAVSQVEEQFIERALGATGGRVTEAAQLLGLSRKGLFLKRRRRRMLTAPDTGTRRRA